MAIFASYANPDNYSDRIYEAALRAYGMGPEELDKIDWAVADETMYGHKFPRHMFVRPQLVKNYSGPIGSYRMADWQPANMEIDEKGRQYRPNSMTPGPVQSDMPALDQWGRQWSQTSPEWVKVDGDWHNVSKLLWGGYRSDERRKADQEREAGIPAGRAAAAGRTTHTSGAQTMTQPTSAWAAADKARKNQPAADAKASQPKGRSSQKTAKKTSKKKPDNKSQVVNNQYAKHQPGDLLANYSPAMRGYY